MSRRSFLGSVAALAFAPAVVRAESLMRVVKMDSTMPAFMMQDVSGSPEALRQLLMHGSVRCRRVAGMLEVWSNADVLRLPRGLLVRGAMTVSRGTLEHEGFAVGGSLTLNRMTLLVPLGRATGGIDFAVQGMKEVL